MLSALPKRLKLMPPMCALLGALLLPVLCRAIELPQALPQRLPKMSSTFRIGMEIELLLPALKNIVHYFDFDDLQDSFSDQFEFAPQGRWESLSPEDKARILISFKTKRTQPIPIKLKANIPPHLLEYFRRMEWIRDGDTMEFRYFYSWVLRDPQVFLSDLETMVDLVGAREELKSPTLTKSKKFTYHYHVSDETRDLRPLTSYFNDRLFLKRVATGNMQDFGDSNTVQYWPDNLHERGLIRVIDQEGHHMEFRAHPEAIHEELPLHLKALSLPENEGIALLKSKVQELMTPETLVKIARNEPKFLAHLLDRYPVPKEAEFRQLLRTTYLRLLNSADSKKLQNGIALALLDAPSNPDPGARAQLKSALAKSAPGYQVRDMIQWLWKKDRASHWKLALEASSDLLKSHSFFGTLSSERFHSHLRQASPADRTRAISILLGQPDGFTDLANAVLSSLESNSSLEFDRTEVLKSVLQAKANATAREVSQGSDWSKTIRLLAGRNPERRNLVVNALRGSRRGSDHEILAYFEFVDEMENRLEGFDPKRLARILNSLSRDLVAPSTARLISTLAKRKNGGPLLQKLFGELPPLMHDTERLRLLLLGLIEINPDSQKELATKIAASHPLQGAIRKALTAVDNLPARTRLFQELNRFLRIGAFSVDYQKLLLDLVLEDLTDPSQVDEVLNEFHLLPEQRRRAYTPALVRALSRRLPSIQAIMAVDFNTAENADEMHLFARSTGLEGEHNSITISKIGRLQEALAQYPDDPTLHKEMARLAARPEASGTCEEFYRRSFLKGLRGLFRGL